MKQTETALQKALEQLQQAQKENEIIRKIATPKGFYGFYFEKLKEFPTNISCFNHINELYYKYFNEYKYESYNSFRNVKNKFLKK